jgi:hypothetical protein
MHLVKGHHCCPNFLAQPIRRKEKFGPTSKLAIYDQKCKLSKQTNRQISLALWVACKRTQNVTLFPSRMGGRVRRRTIQRKQSLLVHMPPIHNHTIAPTYMCPRPGLYTFSYFYRLHFRHIFLMGTLGFMHSHNSLRTILGTPAVFFMWPNLSNCGHK